MKQESSLAPAAVETFAFFPLSSMFFIFALIRFVPLSAYAITSGRWPACLSFIRLDLLYGFDLLIAFVASISSSLSRVFPVFVIQINRILEKRDSMKDTLAANIETVLTEVDGISMDEVKARLEELQKELLKVANSKGNYDSITDEIYRLRELKQSAMVDSAEREGLKLRIDEMRQFLDEQTESITEYDEQLTRRLIEKITVYEDHFTIEFKSGTSMEIHR